MKTILILFALLKFEAMKYASKVIQTDTHEGRETYTITIEGKAIEHAYKEEIINYLVTDEFTYNENLTLFNK
ncbi:MAG: hypothetical protein EB127_23960 [Alphaproteobacteria bacterium]|nr:hypothetical protein [Alphaproteobacteria bacterium]